ncbi:MAG: CRISPR-associated helicase Cas3' [Thermomicrobium sp.]|nr:CRISPR-associated helicase Cas3' [Thermomicrobium sp.]
MNELRDGNARSRVFDAYESIEITAPTSHQVAVWNAVAEGKSFILRAPTGSGKTEAAIVPYLVGAGIWLPQRLIYALPLRSVTGQVKERIDGYAQKLGRELRTSIQHGQQPESVLFAADAVVATIDQVIASYACAPLTLPVRHGNIPAGAVISSYLVFDEVHLLHPQLGLQAMRIVCERLRRLGLPFGVMTATLPEALVDAIAEDLATEPIRSWEEFVARNITIEYGRRSLDAPSVVAHLERGLNRILVVCNTVDRAIALYRVVRSTAEACGYVCQLLHARFLPEDRRRKEEWIARFFGKQYHEEKVLLVATQVVEVGLDISADLLLTELAPIDAFAQRIGRVARWSPRAGAPAIGEVHVFEVPGNEPYDEGLMIKTREILATAGRWSFSWPSVQEMVDRVLTDRLKSIWADMGTQHQVIATLSQAAFEGNRRKASAAVREQDTVQVSVADFSTLSDNDALRLPWIDVALGTARRWVRQSEERGSLVQRLTVDERAVDDGAPTVSRETVRADQLRFGDRLLFPYPSLSYDAELGLSDNVYGQPFEPREQGERVGLTTELPCETWLQHVANVLGEIRRLITQDQHAVQGLARGLGCDPDDVVRAAALAAVLHDLGKLTRDWQKAVGIPDTAAGDELLAHTGVRRLRLPIHATVSAYSCHDAIRATSLPRQLQRAAVFAIAHHHSVRAREVPAYRFHAAWRDALGRALQLGGLDGLLDLDRIVWKQASSTDLRDRIPPFHNVNDYNAYVLLARWLRLADRIATGGQDAVCDYENWFGSV